MDHLSARSAFHASTRARGQPRARAQTPVLVRVLTAASLLPSPLVQCWDEDPANRPEMARVAEATASMLASVSAGEATMMTEVVDVSVDDVDVAA